MNNHRCKLVTDIVFSTSQEEVKRYIQTAMNDLFQHKVNKHLVNRFVERIRKDLAEFKPMNYGSQQWSNIESAMNHFDRLKRELTIPQ